MKDLRVVFMGTPQFAVPSLERIYHSNHKIVGIVTQPDRPRGRGQKTIPTAVKEFSVQHKIEPIFQPVSLKEQGFINSLSNLNADVFVVVAFRILPEEVFTIPPKGTINLHPSLLPKYRGAAPINWTIINGEKETGVTTIFIKREIDAGNVILKKKVLIEKNETAGHLHDRLADMGSNLLMESLDKIYLGEVQPTHQDETKVTKAPKISKEITHLKFNQSANVVKNWIHGLSPIPGAYVYYCGKKIKIYHSEVVSADTLNNIPGKIIKVSSKELWAACQPGIISILELQLEGKKVLGVEEFLRGNKFEMGELFQ